MLSGQQLRLVISVADQKAFGLHEMWDNFPFIRYVYLSLFFLKRYLLPTVVAWVYSWSASEILSVCPHDKTKTETAETKIVKHGTEIVHHDTSPTN